MTHEWHMTVRGYELDSFGHVNNAVYLNYLEQARWEIFREKNLAGYFSESGKFLVVVETTIRYTREAKLFDELVVKTSMRRANPFLIFTQKIFNVASGEKVTAAEIKTLLLDGERIPHNIPDEFLDGE